MIELKEKIIEEVERQVYTTPKDLAKALHVPEEELAAPVRELMDAHELALSGQGKVTLASTMGYFVGRLELKRGGYFFLRTKEGMQDIFIGAKERNGALDGEEVLVRLKKRQGRGENPEGKVVQILTPGEVRIVGVVHKTKKTAKVLTGDKSMDEVIVRPAKLKGARGGQMVVVRLTNRSIGGRKAEGEVVEVLGREGAPGVDILACARRYGLTAEFNAECKKQAAELTGEALSVEGRLDLRGDKIITIDGADAKDLDDAVSLKRLEGGNWQLGVHIADVSHYVTEGTPLDREAQKRGTSAYLIDQVIPMLPHELSNDLCSLNPGEDKYTLSCIMEISDEGSLVDCEIATSLIKTAHRMTYDDVNCILEGDAALRKQYKDIVDMLEDMNTLAKRMRKRRFDRGSIDFDLNEAEIHLDENGVPDYIGVRARGDSQKLIEEFMLKCNITVAQHFYAMDMPLVYRIHEQPDADKMHELAVFLGNFGIKLRGKDDIQPKDIQVVLNGVEGKPEGNVVNSVTLRSLKKAKYDVRPIAHFGLAADQYCHFTSPIRRYPDLMVHRLVKLVLDKKMRGAVRKRYEELLPDVARVSSEREINAVEAERAVNDMKMAEYMAAHIGEEFDGVVSGVTKFGIFVELENTVEGMVPLAQMEDDYYVYHEKQYCVIGERTAKKITLGDKTRVRAVAASEGKIEFEFVE